jgi:hypothetical protein
MRDLARRIVSTAAPSPPGAPPTMGDLYFFFLQCFDNDAAAAEAALSKYLEGKVPDRVRSRIQQRLGGVAKISE